MHRSGIYTAALAVIISVLLVIPLSGEAFAGQTWTIDFEKDDGLWTLPPENDMNGVKVRLVGADEGALSGSKSIEADSMGQDSMWHEFLHTTDKVALKPNTRYYVRMDYKIADIVLGEPGERPAFYFMLRSRSLGPNDATDVYGPFWLREQGAAEEVGDVLVTGDGVEDYYLNIGIRRQGKLIVDNIVITEISGPSPAHGKGIKPLPPDTHPAWGVFRSHRDEYDLARKLDEMTVVGIFEMCNGTMGEVVEFMKDHVRPDALDWASSRHPGQFEVAKTIGSWYTLSYLEYQEHYIFEGPELWDRRWELLTPSGMMRTLANQINYWEVFGEGGYFMCHNGPFWNEYYRNYVFQLVNMGQGICQDNIGVPPFTTARGCFCQFCEELFREHMRGIYTENQLRAFGVEDLADFSARLHILEHGLIGKEALEDALVREYIRFQYLTHRDRWMEHAAAFKGKAEEAGRTVSTSGNQFGMIGAFAVALSPTNDIIEVERLEYFPDYRPNNVSAAYKIGRASGHNERPVWFRGTNHIGPEEDLNTSWVCQEAQYGEAASNGGIRTIHMADDHWPSLEVTKAFTRIPEMREMTKGWADLLRKNRAIFSNRDSMARVALVYSQPTMMWNEFWALDLLPYYDPWARFEEASRSLDAAHVPHDVLILGYPGLWDDAWSIEQMSRYDALIIPSADCISDEHVVRLTQYIADGGKVYVGDGFGEYNEHHEARSLRTISMVRKLSEAFNTRQRTIDRIAGRYGLKTDAPSKMVMNPWLSANGHALALHVVNYDLHAGRNELNTPGRVTVEMPLPEGRRTPYDSAHLLTATGPQVPPRVSYDFSRGTVTLQFDLQRPYGVVVLSDDKELRAKETEIRVRRANMQSELRRYNEANLHWPPRDHTGANP